MEQALGREKEGHTPVLLHVRVLGLLLDLLVKLEEPEIRSDPKVTLK
jgi:hypothetical protein